MFAADEHVGAYRILALLGSGGMGQVFRAHDSKLNRDVALKVLPRAYELDPDRLARFWREAQALAALNHHHIAAIYGIDESHSRQALVLERARRRAGLDAAAEAHALEFANSCVDASRRTRASGRRPSGGASRSFRGA
jgi:Protein kinase domain